MEYLMQFAVIAAVYFLGETISFLIPLPIPGTVYGLVLMFIFLCTGVIKLKRVEKAADFLLNIMPIMFVPGSAAVLEYLDVVSGSVWKMVVICVTSTFITLGVAGWVAVFAKKLMAKRRGGDAK